MSGRGPVGRLAGSAGGFVGGLDAVVSWSWIDHWERLPLDRRILYVMERLVDRYGYAVWGAAGLVGNLVAESGVIPTRLEGSKEATPMRSKAGPPTRNPPR